MFEGIGNHFANHSKNGIAVCRETFGGALTAKATSMILCHNHPSGAVKPSIQDDSLTNKLSSGAKLLDLRVLDHIIITADNYFSYADERRLIV